MIKDPDTYVLFLDCHKRLRHENGKLFWKIAINSRIRINEEAGNKRRDGYSNVSMNRVRHFTHRLVFLMYRGYLPQYVDHIDGDPSNNRIENLRAANAFQNAHNSRTGKANRSGVKGVNWNKQNSRWLVRIKLNNECKYIGYFDDLFEAEIAIRKAREMYHGEFANHGDRP